MSFFRNLTIRSKLTVILVGIVGLVLASAGAAFLIKDARMIRLSMIDQYSALADVLGANSTVALAFDDTSNAEDVLSTLKLESTVAFARTYDANGEVFATYQAEGFEHLDPPRIEAESMARFTGDFLHVAQPIEEDGEVVGSIYLLGTKTHLNSQLRRDLFYGALVLIVCLIVAYFMAASLQSLVSQPIMELAQATMLVSSNHDYSIRVDKHGNDELGVLYDGFNSMLNQIEQRDNKLASEIAERKRAEKRFSIAVNGAPTAMIMADIQGAIVLMNAAANQMFGYERDELVGEPIDLLLPERFRHTHSKHQDGPFTNSIDKSYENDPTLTLTLFSFTSPFTNSIDKSSENGRELFGLRRNGSEFPVEIGLSSIETDEGIFSLNSFMDISLRKQAEEKIKEWNVILEQRVSERTESLGRRTDELAVAVKQLERSNQELDDFAYIASHDLKEPLRGISNYASFLDEDYRDLMDEEGREKLVTLTRLCTRMEDLINSLLHFSRVGRADMAVQETNLNELLDGILDSLHVTLLEREIDVRIPESLPILKCDRVRIGEVFRNLITNGYKYNDKPEKWIEIGFTNDSSINDETGEAQTQLALYVRDNGIGIREKHLGSIFRIFKRLHGRDKFGGGTGAGLTFVKKIIERHGGKIWVQSTYGEGTTFYFTLEGG